MFTYLHYNMLQLFLLVIVINLLLCLTYKLSLSQIWVYGENMMYIRFGAMCGLGHLLGILECIPVDEGGLLYLHCPKRFSMLCTFLLPPNPQLVIFAYTVGWPIQSTCHISLVLEQYWMRKSLTQEIGSQAFWAESGIVIALINSFASLHLYKSERHYLKYAYLDLHYSALSAMLCLDEGHQIDEDTFFLTVLSQASLGDPLSIRVTCAYLQNGS